MDLMESSSMSKGVEGGAPKWAKFVNFVGCNK